MCFGLGFIGISFISRSLSTPTFCSHRIAMMSEKSDCEATILSRLWQLPVLSSDVLCGRDHTLNYDHGISLFGGFAVTRHNAKPLGGGG